jgi:hypothetical protein
VLIFFVGLFWGALRLLDNRSGRFLFLFFCENWFKMYFQPKNPYPPIFSATIVVVEFWVDA